MFAVGAIDAYFSDAYADLVAATAISKQRHPSIVLPDSIQNIKVPIRAVLETYNSRDWRWRMAARTMVDSTSFLSLESIRKSFNPFFRKSHKLFGDTLTDWIQHPAAKIRLFGMSANVYSALNPAGKDKAMKNVQSQFAERYDSIFQRRHDCIHNCDRPRLSPQPLTRAATVERVVQDAVFLVERCDDHITLEFREFLLGCGCPTTVITQAGY
ncbi:MAG: hypothetical protein FJ286_08220 [Planctomycetes bacterium]|nr:hypothetical protein [Planctomycetota bacterium]